MLKHRQGLSFCRGRNDCNPKDNFVNIFNALARQPMVKSSGRTNGPARAKTFKLSPGWPNPALPNVDFGSHALGSAYLIFAQRAVSFRPHR